MRQLMLIVVILALAGCNLDTSVSVTLAPSPTPLILPSPTTDPALFATPVPAQTVVEQPPAENVIQAFVNNLIVPIFNFFLSFVTDAVASLWALAGVRGGSLGQALCCVAPGGAVGLLLFARVRVRRRG